MNLGNVCGRSFWRLFVWNYTTNTNVPILFLALLRSLALKRTNYIKAEQNASDTISEYYRLILNCCPPLTNSVSLSVQYENTCTRDLYVLFTLVEHSKPFDSLRELYTGFAVFMLGSNGILILWRHPKREVKHNFSGCLMLCFAEQHVRASGSYWSPIITSANWS